MNRSKDYKKGYEDGRRDEAIITLGNLYIILDQMTGEPHEGDLILACIKDLEKELKMNRKDFE